MDLEVCNEDCDDKFKLCKEPCKKKSNAKKFCKKECKRARKTCKLEACNAANPCVSEAACEDNNISGLGTIWCETNAAEPSFCNGVQGPTHCKKTCELCD